MQIILNNIPEDLTGIESLNVAELLRIRHIAFRTPVVRLNGKIVRKPDYESTFICEGDQVIIINLLNGG